MSSVLRLGRTVGGGAALRRLRARKEEKEGERMDMLEVTGFRKEVGEEEKEEKEVKEQRERWNMGEEEERQGIKGLVREEEEWQSSDKLGKGEKGFIEWGNEMDDRERGVREERLEGRRRR